MLPYRLRAYVTWGGVACALGLGLLAAYTALRVYRVERQCFTPSPHPPRKSVQAFGIPGLEAVTFRSRSGDRIAGVYVAPEHGHVVILTHGSGGDRSDLAGEAGLLAEAGFGVLSFDWPGHGESEGPVEWGRAERQALEGALDWLEKRPGVLATQVGVIGFSMGGYIVAQVAAGDPRLAAVVLSATPHDPIEHTRWEYRRLGPLTQWPALLALRSSGFDPGDQTPERVVARIAPRPLLLVRGSEDESVAPWMTARLADAARSPKRVLIVDGAGHGGFLEANPEGYTRELVQFFGQLRAHDQQGAVTQPLP
jgi:pimeloyl-ACP methyl ester carboxylesterase